ncbi:MAG: IS200/IS605 family transposase [Bacilli bacterium]|nr:IS200/IS605 family transposase [Bacilli bacterium]
MEIYSNNHSVFSLHYHLILVTKYRKQVIDDSISSKLKDIFCYVSKNYHIELEEWNHDIDHVNVLFRSHPNTNISKFINAYKSASSRLIKKEYHSIKDKLYKEFFWSQSFCLLTTGEASIEVIKEYIETQGMKHDNKKSV